MIRPCILMEPCTIFFEPRGETRKRVDMCLRKRVANVMDALHDLFAVIFSIICIGFGELRTICKYPLYAMQDQFSSRDEENFY